MYSHVLTIPRGVSQQLYQRLGDVTGHLLLSLNGGVHGIPAEFHGCVPEVDDRNAGRQNDLADGFQAPVEGRDPGFRRDDGDDRSVF